MKVLALTYQFEVEVNGKEHLKTEPEVKKSVLFGPKPPAAKVDHVAGFFMPKKTETDDDAEADKLDEEIRKLAEQVEGLGVEPPPAIKEEICNEEEEVSEFSDDQDDDNDDEDDDDDGWITPGNIQDVKHSMNGNLETVQLDVACLTTDFAMQVRQDSILLTRTTT